MLKIRIAGTTINQKYLANILSASRLRAHTGHPLAVEETIAPQSRHGLRLIVFPSVRFILPPLAAITDSARMYNH
jgi:hypothetical protein